MAKVTFEVADRFNLRTYNGEPVYVETGKHLAPVAAKLFEIGMRTILTNCWNGGGKDATEAERHAAVMKKLDAWARGEFNVTERGESAYSAYREVFVADCIAAGLTTKAAEDAIKAKVAERLGKDTKATFANFIEATAIEYAEADKSLTRDEAREALERYYASESDRRAKERESAGSKVKLPSIDLAAFRKVDSK
jgi:hypothetical protein